MPALPPEGADTDLSQSCHARGCTNYGGSAAEPPSVNRYDAGYLTGYRSGVFYAISVIQPLADPHTAEPAAIREALRMLSAQVPAPPER